MDEGEMMDTVVRLQQAGVGEVAYLPFVDRCVRVFETPVGDPWSPCKECSLAAYYGEGRVCGLMKGCAARHRRDGKSVFFRFWRQHKDSDGE